MITSTSPHRPDDTVVAVPMTSAKQVAAAVHEARIAQMEWVRLGPAARSAALNQAADSLAAASDDLTALVVREVGKPINEARAEVSRSEAILRYYAQQVFDPLGDTYPTTDGGLLFTSRRPRGVAGLITPWNFPLAIPLWKAAPALAYGNAAVIKPAEAATACALRLAELLSTALPEDLLTVLPGAALTGQALTSVTDVVSFTGSTTVGQAVVAAAAKRGIPVQAEMGGQNPALVLPDADPETTAAMIARAIAGYAGQKCTATKRIIIVGDPTTFTEALIGAVRALPIGDPADTEVVVGPLISSSAHSMVLDAAKSGAASGRVLTGGKPLSRDGWFVQPAVVDSLPTDHILECDEVFGPICSLSTVNTLDEALQRANNVRHGLVGGVYTHDLDAALAVAARLTTGAIKVNAPTTGVEFYTPFGGLKQSGYGSKEQGKAAIELFTTSHTVTIAAT